MHHHMASGTSVCYAYRATLPYTGIDFNIYSTTLTIITSTPLHLHMDSSRSSSFSSWTRVSTDVGFRDKSMKVVQYGTKMLLDFYGTSLSEESLTALRRSGDIARMSRKAFRILKSLNSVSALMRIMNFDIDTSDQEPSVLILKMLEELFYIAFYYYDNKLLLKSSGLVPSISTSHCESRCDITWFLAELSGLASLVLKYKHHLIMIASVKWRIARLQAHQQQESSSTESCQAKNAQHIYRALNNPVPTTFSLDYLESHLEKLESMQTQFNLEFLKYALNTLVSGNYARVWETVLGKRFRLSDTYVGLFGAAAALVAMYETWRGKSASPTPHISYLRGDSTGDDELED